MSGAFIVLEGIDGSGTTTLARRLHRELSESGVPPLLTHEPSPGPVGLFIREILRHRVTFDADRDGNAPDWATMALLFAADRADHTTRVVVPALQREQTVVSDRYTLSSLVYQSLTAPSGALEVEWLRAINRCAVVADVVIVVDVTAEVAAERRARRGGARELFEVDELQRRLAAAYRRAEDFLGPGHRVVHLDGDRSEDEVYADVAHHAHAAIAAAAHG